MNSYCPSGVITKAVLCMSSSATGICQCPLVRSIFDKYFLPLSLRNRSFVVIGSGSTLLILLNFRKSTHTLLEPSFFFTITMGDTYVDVNGFTTPISLLILLSWHMAKGMAYILLAHQLTLNCAESHQSLRACR